MDLRAESRAEASGGWGHPSELGQVSGAGLEETSRRGELRFPPKEQAAGPSRQTLGRQR